MAEESPTGGERTEDATDKRRADFREKGQVAQSKEVQSAMLFTLMLLFWVFYLPTFWHELSSLITSLLQSVGEFTITQATTLQVAQFLVKHVGLLILPVLILSAVVGVLSSYMQVGWIFTTKPLIPDLQKLDPIQGSKKFFSIKSLVDMIKSFWKVILIGYVAYSTIIDKFDEALLLPDTSPEIAVLFLAKTAALLFAKVCATLILIAFIDFLYVKWEMEQKMKMSKQELKEEHKESEGDAQIKSRIRSIQMDMARKRMMTEVPEADVVITNPTHYAVAVKYDSDQMDAPIILAKGMDKVALKIKEIARDNEIPIIENPPVARLLHKIELGAHIPEEMFKAVAEILAHVYTIKGKLK